MREFPKRVRIEVTQRDIKAGVKQSVCNCPIARATRRALKVRDKNLVGVCNTIDVGCGLDGLPVRYEMPLKATDFIKVFDKGLSVKPFSFVAIRL